jgi:hypothetical protein
MLQRVPAINAAQKMAPGMREYIRKDDMFSPSPAPFFFRELFLRFSLFSDLQSEGNYVLKKLKRI